MPSENLVILMGHMGQDPDVRHTQSGKTVANFSLATNDRYKDKAGEWQDRTEWHKVVAWDWKAETVSKHGAKGKAVYVRGRLQTRKWEDRDGKKRYTTEVVADKVGFSRDERDTGRDDTSTEEVGDESTPF
jgi:single-strand DNA-binding protein